MLQKQESRSRPWKGRNGFCHVNRGQNIGSPRRARPEDSHRPESQKTANIRTVTGRRKPGGPEPLPVEP